MTSNQNGVKHQIHPGNAKRLSSLVDDYVLTMQHALRQDLRSELISRAKEEAGILPEFSPGEMYDYLVDTDDEFFNWCFPFCAIVLKKDNLGYLHARILSDFRKSLDVAIPSDLVTGDNFALVTDTEEGVLLTAKTE